MSIGAPLTHVVRPGEGVGDLARTYDTTPEELGLYNPGVDLTRLRPGQTLNLPPRGAAASPGYGAKR